MRVIVDRNRCCGSGQCVRAVPGVFDQGDDGIVLLLEATPAKERHAAVREAADVCPSGAIQLEE